jgi:hypothetical protein
MRAITGLSFWSAGKAFSASVNFLRACALSYFSNKAHYPRCMIIRESMPKAEEIGKTLKPSQIIIMKQSA